jgi:hypothetical protein
MQQHPVPHNMCANVLQLQSELDAARKSHKEALEAASAAEKKALLLEVGPPAGIIAVQQISMMTPYALCPTAAAATSMGTVDDFLHLLCSSCDAW